jgi:hypothetical protein
VISSPFNGAVGRRGHHCRFDRVSRFNYNLRALLSCRLLCGLRPRNSAGGVSERTQTRVVAESMLENAARESAPRKPGFGLQHLTQDGVTEAALPLDARPSIVGSTNASAAAEEAQ